LSTRVIGRGKCPRCGREGSIVLKSVGGRIYVYFKHGNQWCYLGPLESVDLGKLIVGSKPVRECLGARALLLVVSLCLAVTSILVDALLDPRIGLVLAALYYIVTMPTLGSFTGGRPFLAACLVLYPVTVSIPLEPAIEIVCPVPGAGFLYSSASLLMPLLLAPIASASAKSVAQCVARSSIYAAMSVALFTALITVVGACNPLLQPTTTIAPLMTVAALNIALPTVHRAVSMRIESL